MSRPNRWVLGARPRTLPAAVVPVLVGTAAAAGVPALIARVAEGDAGAVFDLATGGTGGLGRGLVLWRFLCALVVAVAVQVATNYANDYSDGVRGTDQPGKRVGPPRLVGNGLATPGEVKRAMLVAFGVTALAGTPLVLFVDWRLALVGVAAVAAGWFYTGGSRPYGYAGFGEAFVFVFFGMVATVGSAWVQSEQITGLAVVCGVAVGCLATALLVINNLRDIPGDTRAAKRTLAVRLGDRRTRTLYVVLLVVPIVLVPVVAGGYGRGAAVAALFAVLVARKPVTSVLEGASGPGLIPVLGATARVQLVYGGLLAAGLYLSA